MGIAMMGILFKIAFILIAVVEIAAAVSGGPSNVTGLESVNTSIGSQVEFKCLFQNLHGCPLHVQWKINGSDVRKLPMSKSPNIAQTNCFENQTNNATMILYFLESRDIMWDNSEIVCTGRVVNNPSRSVIHISDSALLRIQGVLGQPPDLTVGHSADSDSLIISWNLPYTLIGVDILKIYVNVSSYSISDDSKLLSLKSSDVSGNMTSSAYNISASCAIYNVSVQAVTLAGNGEPSYGNQTIFGRGLKKLTSDDVAINIAYDQQNISVTFAFNDSNCEYEQADMVGVLIKNGSIVVYLNDTVELKNLSYAKRQFTVILSSAVKHLQASATINLTNTTSNSFTESMLIFLNLFDVQDLSLHPIPSGIEVKCVFVTNSPNENCKVVVWCNDCNSGEHHDIDLSSKIRVANFTTCEIACNSSVYCLFAFDVYNSMETSAWTPAVAKRDITITTTSLCSVNPSNHVGIVIGTIVPSFVLLVIITVISCCICIYCSKSHRIFKDC